MDKLMKMLGDKKGIPMKDENQKEALRSVIMELKKFAQGMMADDLKERTSKDGMPEADGLIAKVKMAKIDSKDGEEIPGADEVQGMIKDESMTPGADSATLEHEEIADGDEMAESFMPEESVEEEATESPEEEDSEDVEMKKLRMLMKKKPKDGEKK